jgi:hypothetical protein
MSSIYYVYHSFETNGRSYIGARKCPEGLTPELDNKYLGSFSDKSFSPTHKEILKTFPTYEEALALEILLHSLFKVDINESFANKARQTSKKFINCNSKPKTIEHRFKLSLGSKDNLNALGHTCSLQTKEKMSSVKKGKKPWNTGKSGIKKSVTRLWYNTNTNEYLTMSITDLIKTYPVYKSSSLNRLRKGLISEYRGLRFIKEL